MGYITNADIEERLGSTTYVQLADDDGDGIADSGVVNEVRLGAEGELDSYLARRYQTPIDLNNHPELSGVLQSAALDLAEHRLRQRRPPVPESAVKMKERITKWLIRLAEGSIDLPSLSALLPSTTRGEIGTITGAERLLSHDELSDH